MTPLETRAPDDDILPTPAPTSFDKTNLPSAEPGLSAATSPSPTRLETRAPQGDITLMPVPASFDKTNLPSAEPGLSAATSPLPTRLETRAPQGDITLTPVPTSFDGTNLPSWAPELSAATSPSPTLLEPLAPELQTSPWPSPPSGAITSAPTSLETQTAEFQTSRSMPPTLLERTNFPSRPSAATRAPTYIFGSPAPSIRTVLPPTPAPAAVKRSSNATLLTVVLSCVVFLVLVVGSAWFYRRHARMKLDEELSSAFATVGPSSSVSGAATLGDGADGMSSHLVRLASNNGSAPQNPLSFHDYNSSPSPSVQHEVTGTENVLLPSMVTMSYPPDVKGIESTDASPELSHGGNHVGGDIKDKRVRQAHVHLNAVPEKGRSEATSASRRETEENTDPSDGHASPELSGIGNAPRGRSEMNSPPESTGTKYPPSDGGSRRLAPRGIGVGRAVMGAAQEVARMSQVPGISEVAGLIVVLINLATDNSDVGSVDDYMIKRCRSVMILLQRADSFLSEIGDSNEPAHFSLIEDVRDAVDDLVEVIKTYRSRGKISQVMMSTLFTRRQEEAEAVIDAAISRLHLGLQVEVGHKLNQLGDDLRKSVHPRLQRSETPETGPDSLAVWSLEARRNRRQRNLDTVEIPEHYVTVTDELLGKGGFGTVYMADYNGRNAAAKVVQAEHDLGRLNSLKIGVACGVDQREPPKRDHDDVRRRAFLRELQAMIRLRSPHTVNVYGAITSREHRLVLVMELLPGGDLRALLKGAVVPLDETRARIIVGDICAGMSFLHDKETVHGDLKSPNVLFDGNGRAKIADFGTSKWPQLTNSTGLATYSTSASQHTQMSYAWAAPEVLDAKGTSYASDVYSFGVVVWEVLSRRIPWADDCLRDIYVRVAIKGHRPDIPAESPADMAKIISACWGDVPENRPSFNDIDKWLNRE